MSDVPLKSPFIGVYSLCSVSIGMLALTALYHVQYYETIPIHFQTIPYETMHDQTIPIHVHTIPYETTHDQTIPIRDQSIPYETIPVQTIPGSQWLV